MWHATFRITGDAGTQIRNNCVPAFSCGARGGLWTNAEMPSTVGEVKQVPIYSLRDGNCFWWVYYTES